MKRSLPTYVMPRFHHFDEDDRSDLKRAISKFGGKKSICERSGLITIEQWKEQERRTDEATS